MNVLPTMIRRFASWLASALQPAKPPTRFEDGSAGDVATDLSSPGQFKTCRGLVFRHGLDSAPDDEGLRESRWIAFEGVRLRVSLYTPESGAAHRVTFCGKDAKGCSEARAWAARLQWANGVWFPGRESFAKFCGDLGWNQEAIRSMSEIYRP